MAFINSSSQAANLNMIVPIKIICVWTGGGDIHCYLLIGLDTCTTEWSTSAPVTTALDASVFVVFITG